MLAGKCAMSKRFVSAGPTPLADVDVDRLREHFRKFMSPSNMFVIPLKYAGLGELPEFCEAIGQLLGPT
jgi:hypothetical protein